MTHDARSSRAAMALLEPRSSGANPTTSQILRSTGLLVMSSTVKSVDVLLNASDP